MKMTCKNKINIERNCKTLKVFSCLFVMSLLNLLSLARQNRSSHFEFKAHASARNRCHVLRSGPTRFPQHDDGFPSVAGCCRMLPCLTPTVRAWVRPVRRQWRLICLVLACSGQCVLVEQLCIVLRKRLVDDICLTLSPELI